MNNGGVHHHSILASRLTHLHIPTISSSTSPNQEFDFSFSPSSPQIIHQRSHSLVGPSPRLSPDRFTATQFDYSSSDDTTSTSNGGIDVFGAIYDDLDDLKEEEEEEEKGYVDKEVKKMSPADFEILRVIGKGAFGKVFQVRMKKGNTIITDNGNDNGDGDGDGDGDGIFAMKVMRKETIIKNNHVDYMRAERDILTKVEHPFIVQLRYSFQTKSKLYLILDFINGGHLFYHLYRQRIFSEDQARVYTAEIVSAVSHLHKSGIVHRDLKPENILMDSDGHVMLTDFGLAKEIDESSRSNSMCGTTEYMAPEILLSKGHNKDADWWSIGILLFEMISGQPPFTHVNRKKLQEKIINEKLKLPPHLSTEAHSLLKGLIEKDPSKRLGSGPKGADEIKFHKWFKTVNWKRLEAREIQPKFKPDVIGKDCTANFDKCWTAMPLDDSPAPTPTTTGEHFEGYSYVAPNPWLSSQ